jgi:glycosyltransferase involved in cell wall biosynthesis
MNISICIPAYNRARFLPELLDSIICQINDGSEILICEDNSPERNKILEIVTGYQDRHPNLINLILNETNLGYDGNLRSLISHAKGKFCLFLGNDDLLYPGALQEIYSILNKQKECGVIVRSYGTFDNDPQSIKQIFRYFPDELVVAPGKNAIALAFRRSVVIPGMVIHRDSALKVATDKFDGSLLYQLYLVGMILAYKAVVFTPKVLALRRDGVAPDFGNSKSEQGKFTPKEQTPESSLHFMAGMLEIAQYVEQSTALAVYKPILSDIGAYSYPVLSIQAEKSKTIFLRYGVDLAKLGLWKHPLFYIYFALLLVFGPDRTDSVVKYIKQVLGYTPRLGALPGSVK